MIDDIIKSYGKALIEVEAMGATFEDILKKKDVSFSKEYFCWMFEAMLQHSLIEMSCYDNVIDKQEIALISKVTKYADIIGISNSVLGTKLSWDNFAGSDVESVKKWLNALREKLMPMSITFSSKFAVFDKMLEGDSIEVVTEGVAAIVSLLSAIDGNLDKEEGKSFVNTMLFEALGAIKALLAMEE